MCVSTSLDVFHSLFTRRTSAQNAEFLSRTMATKSRMGVGVSDWVVGMRSSRRAPGKSSATFCPSPKAADVVQ